MNTIKHTLTIRGEEREIEFEGKGEGFYYSVGVRGLFSKGGKNWSRRLTAVVENGEVLRVLKTETILNRAGYRLIAWDEESFGNRSNHHSA